MISSVNDYIKKCSAYNDISRISWYDDDSNSVYSKTYGEYFETVKKCAAVISEIVCVSGNHIAVLAENSYYNAVVVLAIIYSGNVVVPVNHKDLMEVVRYQIEFADVSYVFTDDPDAFSFDDVTVISIADIIEKATEVNDYMEESDSSGDDLAMMLYTSGTTDNGKCVMHSQRTMFAVMEYLEDLCRTVEQVIDNESNSFFHILPLYHTGGLATFFGSINIGKNVNMCLNLKNLMRDIQFFKNDYTLAVPIIIETWAKLIMAGKREMLGNIQGIISSGAKTSPEVLKVLSDNGFQMAEAYAMTETFSGGLYNVYSVSNKLGSIGTPSDKLNVSIIDGELCFKGNPVMIGYYKRDDLTAETVVDGWLHTGDLVEEDSDYYYFVGRKKNLIILSSGENVSPEELETMISRNSKVKEVLVYAEENTIVSEIYCEDSDKVHVEEYVKKSCKELPFYKRVNRVIFRDIPFEKTGSNKIKRHN